MGVTRKVSLTGFGMLLLSLSSFVGVSVAEENVDRDWPTYNNDLLGQRFSPLKEINTTNVGNLAQVCTIKVQEGGMFQGSPIVVDGEMYVTTSHDTIAIDAATCAEKWRHKFVSATLDVWPVNRGAAFANGKLFRGLPTGDFLALDAATGKQLWIDQVGIAARGEYISAAPVAWNGLVFTGVAASDFGVRGRVLALDQNTGREVWRFNTIPMDDELGADTWKNPNTALTGGGGIWTTMTLDVSTGELFVPVGNPAPTLAADYRPGDNLFTNSVLSLDARTGRLRWYLQQKRNDSTDHDLGAAPVVFRDPNVRDILVYVGKDGQLTAIDRSTKGKMYSVAVTTTDGLEKTVDEIGVHVCPGIMGGVEWNGPSYDPEKNAIFVGAVDWCTTFKKGKPKYVQGQFFFGGEFTMDDPKSAAGWITAVDATTGAIKWKYKTGKPVVAGITPTAGGLVFAGDTSGKFFALDKETGKPLYNLSTPGMLAGGIITYTVKGRQYVAVSSGNVSRLTFGEFGDPSIIVLSLPK